MGYNRDYFVRLLKKTTYTVMAAEDKIKEVRGIYIKHHLQIDSRDRNLIRRALRLNKEIIKLKKELSVTA